MQVTHVEAMCEEIGCINILLDRQAGDWGKSSVSGHNEESSLADSLYSIARNCIEDNKRRRPDMTTVVQRLEEITKFIT